MNRIINGVGNLIVLAVMAYFLTGFMLRMINPWHIVALIAVVALLPFLFGPILIRRTYRMSLNPSLVPFDPEGPGSPEELRSHFAATTNDLDRLGFEPVRYYQLKMTHSGADGWVLFHRNGKTGETSRVITSVGTSDVVRIGTSFVVFVSDFSDGTRVVTSNRDSAYVHPPRKPPYHGRAFPQVRDVGHLYVAHRARVESLAAGRIAIDPARDDPDGYLRSIDIDEPFAYHVACGYAYNDEMGGVQRATWKGAILSTWKLLPPIKQIRLGWERLMAARQLGNLRVGRPVT